MIAFLNSKAVLAVIIFFAIEVLLFRTGLYNKIVKPASFAGMLMQRCEFAKSKRHGTDAVALLGDSRLREGFSARIFDRLAAKSSLQALNLGLSGSDPRVWYYFLKNVDPNCASFKMIVLALPSYRDEDYAVGTFDKRDDLQLLLPILGLNDAVEFTQTFREQSTRMEVIASMCSKMYGFKQDLKDFFANPLLRAQECKFFNEHWQEADYSYTGHNESLVGARLVNDQVVGLPSFITPYQKQRLQLTLLGLSEREPRWDYAYLQFWLNKLMVRYASSPTKLVFIRIPARPFSVPLKHRVHYDSIQMISRLSNVIIHPENLFAFLEKPEYFFDDVHLNSVGRKIFTEVLSAQLINDIQENRPQVAQGKNTHSF